jgi:hypothetical protein
MGRAQIISGGTDGLYDIRLIKEETKASAYKVSLEARLVILDADIIVKQAEYTAAQSAYDAKKAALALAIADYNAGIIDMDALKAVQAEVSSAYSSMMKKYAIYNRLILEKASINKKIAMITSVLAVEDRAGVWCADHTEDLAGEVGTIEINGEKNEILIMPEGLPGLGAIQEAGAGTPAGVFYDWAVRPGWQKFKPTYRTGTITSLTNDICDVTLHAALSSDQSLDINQAVTLTGVPIDYMTCNGSAFEVGDEVVVEFEGQGWNSPKVVGFRTNPKCCGMLWVIPYIVYTGVTFEMPTDNLGHFSTIAEIDYWARLIRIISDKEYEIIEEVRYFQLNADSFQSMTPCLDSWSGPAEYQYMYSVPYPYQITYYKGDWIFLGLANLSYRICDGIHCFYGGLNGDEFYYKNNSEIGHYAEEHDPVWCLEISEGIRYRLTSAVAKGGRLIYVAWKNFPFSMECDVYELIGDELVIQPQITVDVSYRLIEDGQIIGSTIIVNLTKYYYNSYLSGLWVSWYSGVSGSKSGYWIEFSNGFKEFWEIPPAITPGHKYFQPTHLISGVNEAYDPEL